MEKVRKGEIANRSLFSFNNVQFHRRREVILPYLHWLDDKALERSLDKFFGNFTDVYQRVDQICKRRGINLDTKQIADHIYKAWVDKKVSKHFTNDLFNMYYNSMHKLSFEQESQGNTISFKMLGKMNQPGMKILSHTHPLKSLLLTRTLLMNFLFAYAVRKVKNQQDTSGDRLLEKLQQSVNIKPDAKQCPKGGSPMPGQSGHGQPQPGQQSQQGSGGSGQSQKNQNNPQQQPAQPSPNQSQNQGQQQSQPQQSQPSQPQNQQPQNNPAPANNSNSSGDQDVDDLMDDNAGSTTDSSDPDDSDLGVTGDSNNSGGSDNSQDQQADDQGDDSEGDGDQPDETQDGEPANDGDPEDTDQDSEDEDEDSDEFDDAFDDGDEEDPDADEEDEEEPNDDEDLENLFDEGFDGDDDEDEDEDDEENFDDEDQGEFNYDVNEQNSSDRGNNGASAGGGSGAGKGGMNAGTDTALDAQLEEMLNRTLSDPHAMQFAEESLDEIRTFMQNMDDTMDADEMGDAWRELGNMKSKKADDVLAKLDPALIEKMAKEMKRIKMNMGGVKKTIAHLLDKSLNYFSSREEYFFENIFDADSLAGLEDPEMLHPKLRKLTLDDILIKDSRKVGRIDVYVDISGSMGSSCGVVDDEGKAITAGQFAKAMVMKMKEMDLLDELYTFDMSVHARGNSMVDILTMGGNGGTAISNVVAKIKQTRKNSLIITDACDWCNLYDEQAFFLGINGARFSSFEARALQKYAEREQMWVFDGEKAYRVNEDGVPVGVKNDYYDY
jgi:hypothetical protein